VKGFKSAVYPVEWMGLMMICCGDGNVKSQCEEDEGTVDGYSNTDRQREIESDKLCV